MKFRSHTYRILLTALLWVTLIGIYSPTICQNNQTEVKKNVSSDDLRDLKEIVQYEETVKRLRAKRQKSQLNEESTPRTGIKLGPVVKWLLYLLIAGLVIFILFTIFSSVKVDKKIEPIEINTQEEYEDIEEIDTQSGLSQALSKGNYRDAVRMLFIKLLQVLVEQRHIEWKPEKTNRDYLHEMSSHAKVLDFSNLVLAYERIWYGSEPIDKLFFQYLRKDFEKFYSTTNLENSVPE